MHVLDGALLSHLGASLRRRPTPSWTVHTLAWGRDHSCSIPGPPVTHTRVTPAPCGSGSQLLLWPGRVCAPTGSQPQCPRWPRRGSPLTPTPPPQGSPCLNPTTVWPCTPQPTLLHSSAGHGHLCVASLGPTTLRPLLSGGGAALACLVQGEPSTDTQEASRSPARAWLSPTSRCPHRSSHLPSLAIRGAAVSRALRQLSRAARGGRPCCHTPFWDRPGLPRC